MTGSSRLTIKNCHFPSRCTRGAIGEYLQAPGDTVDRMRGKTKLGNAEETPL